ncbi:MAG: tRNA (adenosine(37)-N6)-threonylcarbamoyltransferase complex ATPase subunit type 1 TsaE [Candidatus Woykebacteria bacterium RBG_16_39_9b]|uniref:tRNA threonylcarbamoyladenosine biosynthesis protein TsaE n=1 Tax=Candidatus Woykebacteria bacterium RBG_16_39_9b TaxID=1802595 RepID=A0A1G1WBN5_9BACT|nr:MAG: tRNA (adenosine(37)-N6)-threonylcarbamoyltransferase complex ATPase subunit type 1 TsaE [Candidatus Woykebacteria bacterium RBG_16_39_9b]
MEIISNSSENTKKIAREFSKKLNPGSILAFYGNLGAGKTTFIQGLAEGLGYKGRVFSPTFIFVRPYKISEQKAESGQHKSAIKTLYHIDLYRIEKATDLKTIGIQEFLEDKEAISAIEWAEKIDKFLPKNAMKIMITPLSPTERKITIT